MHYIVWTFRILLILIVGGFLHYTLPKHDVVRIVGDEVRRVEISGWDSMFWNSAEPANAASGNRDIKFISAVRENGQTRVFRNEDTGWGWPPYFKFNSADVQAKAADLTSTSAAPQWVKIRYYGWRNQLLSIYPNATKLTPVASPDVRIIPWFNIVFLIGVLAAILFLWRAWHRFRKNRIDPMVREVADSFDSDRTATQPEHRPYRGRRMKLKEWWVETFG